MPSRHVWLLPYTLLYGLLGVVLTVCLWQGCSRSVFVDEPTHVEAPPADTSVQGTIGRIDPNIAEWHELALLPGMGRKVAQEIVAYRQQRQQTWRQNHPDAAMDQAPPVFTNPQDLLPVKGIGPRTLGKISPYLEFPAQQPSPDPLSPANPQPESPLPAAAD